MKRAFKWVATLLLLLPFLPLSKVYFSEVYSGWLLKNAIFLPRKEAMGWLLSLSKRGGVLGAEAKLRLSSLLLSEGRVKEALSLLDSIFLFSGKVGGEALLKKGVILSINLGRPDLARVEFVRALSLPDVKVCDGASLHQMALFQRALSHLAEGRKAQGARALRDFVRRYGPKDTYLHYRALKRLEEMGAINLPWRLMRREAPRREVVRDCGPKALKVALEKLGGKGPSLGDKEALQLQREWGDL